MDIGTITEIVKDDSALICTVSFGANDVITATLFGLSSRNEYPMIDDQVAVQRGKEEDIIVALFRGVPGDLQPGESITYGRDSGGAIVSSVKCTKDGKVKINDLEVGNATDFVAMSQKVDALWTSLYTAFSSWVVAPNDGGAALKATFTASFPSSPSTVASSNIKGD